MSEDIEQAIAKLINDDFGEEDTISRVVGQITNVAILTDDTALTSARLMRGLDNLPVQEAGNYLVEVTLMHNVDREDNWRDEVLFQGTAGEFISSDDVYVDFDNAVLAFTRPQLKVLPLPGDFPYIANSFEDLAILGSVVYVKNIGGMLHFAEAKVMSVNRETGLVFLQGSFSAQDLGSIVSMVKDGKLHWVGILTLHGASDGIEGVGVVLTHEKLENLTSISSTSLPQGDRSLPQRTEPVLEP